MKTIMFWNLKGGVAKTTSAGAFAVILARDYGKKVLLVDIDKQGNSSIMFERFDNEEIGTSVSNLLLDHTIDVHDVIRHTAYDNIDIINADMRLIDANNSVMIDVKRPHETRLKNHFQALNNEYDFCIIDCPPDLDIAVNNALYAAHHILVPVRVDAYAFVGIKYIMRAISNAQEFNHNLTFTGAFAVMTGNNNLSKEGYSSLDKLFELRYDTMIRNTVKAGESTFSSPLPIYAPNCTASKDYKELVAEYLMKWGEQ